MLNSLVWFCLWYSTFSGNLVSEEKVQSNSSQHAAKSSYRILLHFTGTNQLLHNDGGGLSTMGYVCIYIHSCMNYRYTFLHADILSSYIMVLI